MKKYEFVNKSRAIHGDKYDYSLIDDSIDIYHNTRVKIVYDNVIYEQTPAKHIGLKRCPEKNTPKKTTEEFIEESKKKWGNKYDYSLTVYDGSLKPVKIIYDNIIYEQRANSHLKGLAVEKEVTFEVFMKRAIEKYGDKYTYDFNLLKYENNTTPILITHKDTGVSYLQTPRNHLVSCPEKTTPKKTTKKFIIDANLVHEYKYDYSKTRYEKNNIKVIITCKIHGDFTQTPNSHLQGIGCKSCNESKGEREIAKFLNKNKINYLREHKFVDCCDTFQLPFDFYIPSMRTIVEFDGLQHFQPVEHFGGIEAFEKLKSHDKIKNDYCEEKFINLIRINYKDYDRIHQILWDSLNFHIKNLK